MAIPTVSSSARYSGSMSYNATSDYTIEKVAQEIAIPSNSSSTVENFDIPKDLSSDVMIKHADKMNQMMTALNTDLRFSIHEKTNQLMVQMVDIKKDKVVKEFPPHEFLDMVAKIRDYVGMILDKKA